MALSTRPRRRPTREESAVVDEHVRRAAISSFLDHGFNGTTMAAVAQAAGVTRATVYARYSDKETLFRTVVRWALTEQPNVGLEIDPDTDLREALLLIAQAAYERATDPETSRLGVLLMSEVSRFPDLAPKADQFDRYPFMEQVIKLLSRNQELGAVEVADLNTAAEQFLAVVASHPARLAAFGMGRSEQAQHHYQEAAVDLFIDGVRAH